MTGGAGWPRFTVAEIDAALLTLPERERAVLMAHRIRRMSNAEIAKAYVDRLAAEALAACERVDR